MTGRRVLRSVAAGLLVSSAVVLGWPAGAGAEAPSAQGWWWRPQQSGTPVALPAPPVVPENGLYVAQGPNSENLAISAVQYAVAAPGDAMLTLTLGTGVIGTVAVTACPATSGFTPASAGAWAEAPAYNCTAGAVDGQPAYEGAQLTFALTSDFVSAGGTTMDVVLVPTPGSAPFQAPIAEPGEGSFAPLSTDSGAALPDAGAGVPAPATESFDTGVALPSDGGPLNLGAVSTGASPATGTDGAPRGAAPSAPAGGGGRPLAAPSGAGDRVAAGVVLGLLGAAMWWLSGRPLPRPRLIGGASGDGEGTVRMPEPAVIRVGGIGRFSRPRTAHPNRF